MAASGYLEQGAHIRMVTPAAPGSRSGNRVTALRWARILRDLGYRVDVMVDYHGERADAMIALHAWRSAGAAARFREAFPERPLIVALTGTDLYRFIHSHPESTLCTIETADALVALHRLAGRAIPASARDKLHIIFQHARPLPRGRAPRQRHFDILLAGHLREEKDPLRSALAVRDLPASSRIRVRHFGKAHSDDWARQARDEMAINPRYHWFGERPHWVIRQEYARCRAMVLSSIMEGGATVVSEAIVAGIPVIASAIDGSIGMLGEDYGGYYPVGDAGALRELLLRAEGDADFLPALAARMATLRPLFTPEAEREGWRRLLADLNPDIS